MAIFTDWMGGGGLSGDVDTNVFQSGLTGETDTNILETFPITADNPVPGGSADPSDPSAGPLDWFADTVTSEDGAFGGSDTGGGGALPWWVQLVPVLVGLVVVAWVMDSAGQILEAVG